MKNILLIYGGGAAEHEVSVVSSSYISESLSKIEGINIVSVEIDHRGQWLGEKGQPVTLTGKNLQNTDGKLIEIDYAIPCIHGYPGETGDIQSLFEMNQLPYLGVRSEASKICFNKVSTKLWLDALGIDNTESIFLSGNSGEEQKLREFFDKHGDIYIKAASQGSSVGCYHVNQSNADQLIEKMKEAFTHSAYVLVERTIKGRELEISVFEYEGKVHATLPGEIYCPSDFYTYEEKYSKDSKTETFVVAPNVSSDIQAKIQEMGIKAFKGLKLKDLSRIDFFLTESNEILINEINTFPGMTPISMFPKMMENYGVSFVDFLSSKIK